MGGGEAELFFEGCLVRWNILERTLSERSYWPMIFRPVDQSIVEFPVLDFILYFIAHGLGKCLSALRSDQGTRSNICVIFSRIIDWSGQPPKTLNLFKDLYC